jgi:hypothetical protein
VVDRGADRRRDEEASPPSLSVWKLATSPFPELMTRTCEPGGSEPFGAVIVTSPFASGYEKTIALGSKGIASVAFVVNVAEATATGESKASSSGDSIRSSYFVAGSSFASGMIDSRVALPESWYRTGTAISAGSWRRVTRAAKSASRRSAAEAAISM